MIFDYWMEIVLMCGLALLMYRRPLISLANLLNFYWIAFLVVGLLLFPISSIMVPVIDIELLSKSVWLYVFGFALFSFGVFQYRITRCALSRSNYKIQLSSLIQQKIEAKSTIPWFLVVFCAMLLFVTFNGVGYIPLFAGQTHVTKYFQEDLAVYVSYRPIYTFAINTLSTVLTFSVVMVGQAKKRSSWIFVAGLCVFLLLLTAKRGPVLLPLLYVGLGYSIIKQNIKILFASVIILLSIAMLMSLGISDEEDVLRSILIPLSSSAFVGLRELTRLLTVYDGELLYGKTYIAGLLSFIPTEWFEFKAQYNYMRYIMALQGADPNASGGMRAGYIGEALINFGMIGFGVISYIYGLVVGYVDNWFLRSKWIANHGLIGIIMGISIFQMGIFAFYESGSSAILFFINRIAILGLLIFLCLPRKVGNTKSVFKQHSNLII